MLSQKDRCCKPEEEGFTPSFDFKGPNLQDRGYKVDNEPLLLQWVALPWRKTFYPILKEG